MAITHSTAARSPAATHTTNTSSSIPPNDSDAHSLTNEHRALASLRNSILYLYNPAAAKTDPSIRPSRFRTRAILRASHYLLVVLFWKLYRYAKYAIVGSAVAAIGSVVAAGSLATGIGWIATPAGIAASLGVGTVWGVGRWVWRWAWRRGQVRKNKAAGLNARDETGTVYAKEPDLQAVPW